MSFIFFGLVRLMAFALYEINEKKRWRTLCWNGGRLFWYGPTHLSRTPPNRTVRRNQFERYVEFHSLLLIHGVHILIKKSFVIFNIDSAQLCELFCAWRLRLLYISRNCRRVYELWQNCVFAHRSRLQIGPRWTTQVQVPLDFVPQIAAQLLRFGRLSLLL